MSTGCEFHSDALADLAAGRLDAGGEARVRAHLAACARCREDLEVLTLVAGSEIAPPAGLEARIRAAVRETAGESATPTRASGRAPAGARRKTSPWRPWALPLAAAAGVAAVWLGVLQGRPGMEDAEPAAGDEVTLAAGGYAPYGAWPAGTEVAGEPLLSDLSAEDLELLLEAMEP